VYPDPRVSRFINENFVPVRVHVREQRDAYKRLGAKYGAQWTPTILVLDEVAEERHRVEGFLPADDLLSQLKLGLGHAAFANGRFDDARKWFDEVLEAHGSSDAAPEAMYWSGVSRYKATNDPAALAETARRFTERFQDSPWAKKASVWKAETT
jgi:tetratricopeptide (TPR) repeat protein